MALNNLLMKFIIKHKINIQININTQNVILKTYTR